MLKIFDSNYLLYIIYFQYLRKKPQFIQLK